MGAKILNILSLKWVLKYFRCQMGIQIFYASNGCKKNFGFKWESKYL